MYNLNMTKERKIKKKGDKKLLASFRRWLEIDPEKAEAIYIRFMYGISLKEHRSRQKRAQDIELEWALHRMEKGKNVIIRRSSNLSSEHLDGTV